MKDIKGYEGLYAITSCGKVWSYHLKGFMKLRKDRYGYYYVGLRKRGEKQKNFWIHRLVAEAYIPNKENLETVNHKDYDLTHNYVNNLEWMSRNENASLRRNTKKVECIETGEIFNSCTAAAQSINRHVDSLRHHLQGKSAHCGGYHWRYKE